MPGLRSVTRLPLIYSHKVPSPPITDAEWERIKKQVKELTVNASSQVNLRGVINAILYYLANGHDLNAVPLDYAPPATVFRWSHEWNKTGLFQKIVDSIGGDATFFHDNQSNTVSSLGGELKCPARKRPQISPRHHFATVLYDVDPHTLCTLSGELVF